MNDYFTLQYLTTRVVVVFMTKDVFRDMVSNQSNSIRIVIWTLDNLVYPSWDFILNVSYIHGVRRSCRTINPYIVHFKTWGASITFGVIELHALSTPSRIFVSMSWFYGCSLNSLSLNMICTKRKGQCFSGKGSIYLLNHSRSLLCNHIYHSVGSYSSSIFTKLNV